jgi:hypothetical protein
MFMAFQAAASAIAITFDAELRFSSATVPSPVVDDKDLEPAPATNPPKIFDVPDGFGLASNRTLLLAVSTKLILSYGRT